MDSWSRFFSLFLGCFLIAVLSTSPSTARADDDDDDSWARFMIGLDLDYAYVVDLQSIDSGGGGALRLGSELDLIVITLIPEAYFGYHTFDADGVSVTSGRLGGRIRFGKILEPGLYAHVGIARVGGGPSYTSPVIDGGFTLDFTLLPLIDIGAHAAYTAIFETADSSATPSYATFGLHVALVF